MPINADVERLTCMTKAMKCRSATKDYDGIYCAACMHICIQHDDWSPEDDE